MAKKKVLIIGAGMAGLVAGIELAKNNHKVTIFERNNKIGKKLLVTGNGRCNLTNKHVSKEHYHSQSLNIFEPVYRQFDIEASKELLESLGLDLVELDEGKFYPMSLQAKSVVTSLLLECERLGIDIIYDARITSVEVGAKYKIQMDDKVYYGTQLIIATGGKSYSDSGSSGDGYKLGKTLGHSIKDTYPSIVQLQTKGKYNKSLKGLKYFTEGTLYELKDDKKDIIRVERGEVLFTDYGLSGPVILQLSTMVEPKLSNGSNLHVSLDFMPNMSVQELDEFLMKRLHKLSYRGIQDSLNGFLNQRLILPLLKCSEIELEKKSGDVSKAERTRLVNAIKNFDEKIDSTYLWNQAQVTKGGINCLEIYEDSLESKLKENLYFVGEVLDLDGDCGGYNLQWAISSGAVVAQHIHSK